MDITQADIEELKRIHLSETGEKLKDDEAWEMGNRLVRIYDVLTRVDPEDSPDEEGSNSLSLDQQPHT